MSMLEADNLFRSHVDVMSDRDSRVVKLAGLFLEGGLLGSEPTSVRIPIADGREVVVLRSNHKRGETKEIQIYHYLEYIKMIRASDFCWNQVDTEGQRKITTVLETMDENNLWPFWPQPVPVSDDGPSVTL